MQQKFFNYVIMKFVSFQQLICSKIIRKANEKKNYVHLWVQKIFRHQRYEGLLLFKPDIVLKCPYQSYYWSLVALVPIGPRALLVPTLTIDIHGHTLLELVDQPLPPGRCVTVGHEPGGKVLLARRQMAVVPTKLQDKRLQSFTPGMWLHLNHIEEGKKQARRQNVVAADLGDIVYSIPCCARYFPPG